MTKRQRWVLERLRDGDDLVYERGEAYVGNELIAARTVFALLRLMVISLEGGCEHEIGRGVERYEINETGRKLLEG